MTALLDMQSEVMSHVPQADVISIENALRRAARKFCERTLVLEATTAPSIDIVANQAEYTLPPVANREIVRIKRGGVWWGVDRQLGHRSEDQIDRDAGQPGAYLIADGQDSLSSTSMLSLSDPWRAMTDAEPAVYFQARPNTIRLVPIPSAAYTAKLGVTYHLKPALAAIEVDDFIVANWYETLAMGAIGDLLQIKNKPWSETLLGKDWERRFDDGISDVVNNRVAGYASTDYAVGHVRAWP